jgi:hypothetical protein
MFPMERGTPAPFPRQVRFLVIKQGGFAAYLASGKGEIKESSGRLKLSVTYITDKSRRSQDRLFCSTGSQQLLLSESAIKSPGGRPAKFLRSTLAWS